MLNDIIAQLKAQMPVELDMKLPPPSYVDMDPEVLKWDADAKILVIRFPVLERYQNPMGIMQGGFIVAAADNTFGPLSFLVGAPSVTRELSVTYHRPVTPDNAYIDVEAKLLTQNEKEIAIEARVTNPKGRLMAKVTTIQFIPRRWQS